VQGVFYYNSATKERKPVALEENDASTRPAGFDNIIYDCSNANIAPALLIWEFDNPGLEGGNDLSSEVSVKRMDCQNNITSINGDGSFEMAFESPGVYFCYGGCQGGMCQAYMSDANTNNQDNLGDTFNGNVQGVRIVNRPNLKYGVIFHTVGGLNNGGQCTTPITVDGNSGCIPVDNNIRPFSANIFSLNQDSNSGNGVTFYSEAQGWNTNTSNHKEAGFYNVPKEEIYTIYSDDANKMCFDYTSVDATEAYKCKCNTSESTCSDNPNYKCDDYSCTKDSDCSFEQTCDTTFGVCVGADGKNSSCSDTACENFQDCSGSVEIKGDYLVGIYSTAKDKNNKDYTYCYTSSKTIPNLGVQGILPNGVDKIDKVFIIPTK
jgi:hypothetical protein